MNSHEPASEGQETSRSRTRQEMRRLRAPRLLAAAILALAAGAGAAPAPDALALIRRAGSAEDETARLKILRDLRAAPALDAQLAADLDRMIAFVERWNGESSLYRWFDKEIRTTVDYKFSLGAGSPPEPLACFYRGRMLTWVVNEYGNIIGYHEERRRFLDRAVRDFRIAAAAFPENRVIRMYLGEPVPPSVEYPAPAGAPAWAAFQREGLERLADIVLWWIRNRLGKNGEYGGGWDDDCEMWRHWVPLMIAFEYPEVEAAQAFFSRALLSQDYMKDGYTSHVYDVEHTAEPSSDTITPMMHLAPDDREWKERALRIAALMRERWCGRNERGMLQFKSTYFSAQRVDGDPARACDTPYHAVAVLPVLVLWLRTGDPELTALFSAWLDTWVDAAARSERGKPAGVVPAAIRWPTGEPAGPGPNWWDPRHHGEPKLYEWPSAVSMHMDLLLLAYHMTRQERYLAPIRSMAAIRLAWLKEGGGEKAEPGSARWCGSKLGFLAGTLAKHKLLTGSAEFDEILARDYASLSISEGEAERKSLTRALSRNAEALRINFPGYTSEVRFTDRVLTFPRLFGADMMFAEEVPAASRRPQPELLYATATGDRGSFGVFPVNAVKWLTPPRDIAALVTRAGRDGLTAELFHFGEAPRAMGAELYLLAPGEYELTLADPAGAALAPPAAFRAAGPRTRIRFELPARRLCVARVRVR